MPEIDYVVLADYVRSDAGVIHIMGAGIDTFYVPEGQPVAVPVGLAARITFSSRDEVGVEHSIRLAFQTSADEELMAAEQSFRTPAPAPGVPEHWRTSVGIAFRFPLPIPGHGDYRLQVTLDDDPRLSRTLDVRAVAPPTGQN